MSEQNFDVVVHVYVLLVNQVIQPAYVVVVIAGWFAGWYVSHLPRFGKVRVYGRASGVAHLPRCCWPVPGPARVGGGCRCQ